MKLADITFHRILPGASASRDYERVARAIAYLRRHAGEQPVLAEVASYLGLSDSHFQRLFTRWAGVSAKRFLQYLTVEHAKSCLAESRNVLELAGRAGLSGGGRLHDLFVSVEAMSPGEFRSGGAGLRISWGIHHTQFGPCLLALTERGICSLHFLRVPSARQAVALLRRAWPRAVLQRTEADTAPVAQRVFDPLATSSGQPLALLLKGTNFQLQVWRALLAVPAGSATTYGRLARDLGMPASARAVGNAVGANPVAYLVPCHRVLRESGDLGGYRWGVARKAAVLGWEAARFRSAEPAGTDRDRSSTDSDNPDRFTRN